MEDFSGPTILLFCFIAMEFFAWLMHRFVMHGFLWTLHRDHHNKTSGFFERNDLFLILFAAPALLTGLAGWYAELPELLWACAGLSLYGTVYFWLHDIVIHRRLFRGAAPGNRYLRALRLAHHAHHRHLGRDNGECFGMLLVPWKYYRDAGSKSTPPSSRTGAINN